MPSDNDDEIDIDVTPRSGSESAPEPPEFGEPLDTSEYDNQDLERLSGVRRADCEFAELHFLFQEPRTYAESMELISDANDAAELCRRSLEILVAKPDPLDPILDELGAWNSAVLATAALDWMDIPSLLDEADSIHTLREKGAESFARDPPY